MPDTRFDAEKTAMLARISVNAREAEALGAELDRIVSFMDLIREAEGSCRNHFSAAAPSETPVRRDIPAIPAERDEILSQAPQARSGFFAVPLAIAGRGAGGGGKR